MIVKVDRLWLRKTAEVRPSALRRWRGRLGLEGIACSMANVANDNPAIMAADFPIRDELVIS